MNARPPGAREGTGGNARCRRSRRVARWMAIGSWLLLMVPTCHAAGGGAAEFPALTPSSATAPATTTQGRDLGPDVVILKELVFRYEPVPFDHRSHARMAEMWQGCTTCHHRPPMPTSAPIVGSAVSHETEDSITQVTNGTAHSQGDAERIPACKSCHPVGDEHGEMRMPSLKGAYHRQCLNCHREWAHENACIMCHKPLDVAKSMDHVPTPDDITGRMHPPIPEPKVMVYTARFVPAAGGNITFRHRAHTVDYGIRCAACHHRDTCAHCHSSGERPSTSPVRKPLRPGHTWRDTHGPCIACHKADHCDKCHYKDDQPPPAPFVHETATGQALDPDHAGLKCGQCHAQFKSREILTCGTAGCHKRATPIAFPEDRPGTFTALVARVAADGGAIESGMTGAVESVSDPSVTATAGSQPSTRPTIRRIRK